MWLTANGVKRQNGSTNTMVYVFAHVVADLSKFMSLHPGDANPTGRPPGVGGTIFMETGVDDADYQAETRLVAKLVADPLKNIVGLIASNRPEDNSGYDECSKARRA